MGLNSRCFVAWVTVFLIWSLTAHAAGVDATWNSLTDVPVTASSYTASGSTVHFTLNFAPVPGTSLTVVKNTGLAFINGRFSNLAHGQRVDLVYNGVTYAFVAHYHGGTGNDLVLVWAGTRLCGWSYGFGGPVTGNPNHMLSGSPVASRIPLGMAAGNEHMLALFDDGSVGAWGYNSHGQLGTGLISGSSYPVLVATAGAVLGGKTVIAVAAGNSHSLALCSDGTLAAWGDNRSGQLGTGTTTRHTFPAAVVTTGTPLEGKTVVAISCGPYHNLVLCSDGTVAAWGSNSGGELGSTVVLPYSTRPVAVTTAGTALEGKTVTAIATGHQHNVALCSDGTLAAWGSNMSGELGDATTDPSSALAVPVVTAGSALQGKTVASISAGSGFTLVLCTDGTMAAWGRGGTGCLGARTFSSSSLPVAVYQNGLLQGRTVVGITTGATHSVAWCSDGLVAAWGDNSSNRQLGNYQAGRSVNEPVRVLSAAGGLAARHKQVISGPSANHTVAMVPIALPDGSAPSGDASLASLTLSGAVLDPPFTSDRTFYFIRMATAAPTLITLTPTTRENYASLNINTNAAASGAAYGPLLVEMGGVLDSFIEVTAPDGISKRTYFVSFLFPTLTQQWQSRVNNWRAQNNFWGDSGDTAYTADYDSDGISNLMEYALGLNPKRRDSLPASTAVNGGSLEYLYTRSTAAVNAGTVFSVQWSASPAGPFWNGEGVTETVLSDDGTTQEVKAVIPKINGTSMFARLWVDGARL